MATVNYSVPDKVKAAFNEAFAEENKSAVIAQLMRQAIEEHHRQRRRAKAIDRLFALRRKAKPMSRKAIQAARVKGRR